MVLRATEDYGTPRNIYGVTKKLAEEYCKESSCSVAILRLSRFFAEDMTESARGIRIPCSFPVSDSMAHSEFPVWQSASVTHNKY